MAGVLQGRSEEHTSELQSHSDLHSFPTRRSSDLSFPIRQAVGAGSLFNLIIALPATITFLAQGWGVAGKPADAVGNIAVFCVAALSLPALFVAPAAARWSARVPLVLLRRLFALCLVAIAF